MKGKKMDKQALIEWALEFPFYRWFYTEKSGITDLDKITYEDVPILEKKFFFEYEEKFGELYYTGIDLSKDSYFERGTLTISQQAEKHGIPLKYKTRKRYVATNEPEGRKIKGIRRYKRGLIEFICYRTGYYGFEFQYKMAYNCSTKQLERLHKKLKDNPDNETIKREVVAEIITS